MMQMFWGNLAARPLRCFLSVIAIAIQVVLVLLIVGMTSGVLSDWGKRVEGVGADIVVQPPNASIFFAFSSAVMQESLGDEIEKLPGVDEVAPTLMMTDPKTLMVIYGIDFIVDAGGITALLGANGAGKTTTLRAVCGMVRTEGEILLNGVRIDGRATEDVVRAGVAHVPDAPMGRVLVQIVADGWKPYGHWYDITDPKQVIKIHLERPPKWY